jgi:hypothetical protein
MIRGMGMIGERLWPGWVSGDGKRILAARLFSPLPGRLHVLSPRPPLRCRACLN